MRFLSNNHPCCLSCVHWQQEMLDPIIGRCRKYNEWRFQLEGWDKQHGACPDYQFGEERKLTSWKNAEQASKPMHRITKGQAICRDHNDQIQEWLADGRKKLWITRQLGLSSPTPLYHYLKIREVERAK